MTFRIVFLSLFLTLIPLLGFSGQGYENIVYKGKQLSSFTVITQDNYPQAYAWYQKMIQKYPEAQLDQYSFVIGGDAGWSMMPALYVESKRALIICPYRNICNGFNESDEWALLHEAGHAHNHKNWSLLYQGGNDVTTFAKLGIIATIAAAGTHGYNQNYLGIQEKLKYNPFAQKGLYEHLKGSMTVGGLLIAPVLAYYALKKGQVVALRKIDERYADKFANDHADFNSLKGGIKFFDRLAAYEPSFQDVIYHKLFSKPYFEYYPGFINKIKALMSHYKYNMKELIRYLCKEHPSSASRAIEIRKSLQRRFNEELAKEKFEGRVVLA